MGYHQFVCGTDTSPCWDTLLSQSFRLSRRRADPRHRRRTPPFPFAPRRGKKRHIMFDGPNRQRRRVPTRPRRPLLELLEDRLAPAVVVEYTVTENWGSGFQGQIKLINP